MQKVLLGPGPLATTTSPGQMSAEDKIKLNNLNVNDVQINSTSIVNNNVANIPIGTGNTLGVVKPVQSMGISVNTTGELSIRQAQESHIKYGTNVFLPIVPAVEDLATFYGLAKIAGDTTQSASSNTAGIYTDAAKQAIQTMLGINDAIDNKILIVNITDPNLSGELICDKTYEEISTALNNNQIILGIILDMYKTTDIKFNGPNTISFTVTELSTNGDSYLNVYILDSNNIIESQDYDFPASSITVTQTLTSGAAIATINGTTIYTPSLESMANVEAMLTSLGLPINTNLTAAAAGTAETGHAVVQEG